MSNIFPATAVPDPHWWHALWPDPGRTVDRLGITPGMRVIDLWCGDGWFTLPIARLASEVVGLDTDSALVAQARARIEAAGLSNCHLVEGDAYDIAELAGGAADVVIVANTFHGVPDKARLCQAVASALRPDGKLIIVNWHRRPREETIVLGQPRGPRTEMRMEPGEVVASAKPAGFTLERTVELPPYHYAVVLTLRLLRNGCLVEGL